MRTLVHCCLLLTVLVALPGCPRRDPEKKSVTVEDPEKNKLPPTPDGFVPK